MSSIYALRRPSGNIISAVQVSDCHAIGVSTLNELEQFGLRRPSMAEDAKKREMASDPALKAAHELRDTVQRRFDSPRRKRALSYGNYISGLASGTLLGGTPPLTLFCPKAGTVVEGGLMLPHNTPLIAIDGETQTEARFMRRDADASTGDDLVAFVIYHGIAAEHAGSILHDFNKYAHPITELQAARLNANGSVTQTVSEAIAESGTPAQSIKTHGGQPTKAQIANWQNLLASAVAFAAPDEVMRKGGVSDALAKYNNGAHAISKAAVKPFIIHVLGMAQADRDVATSHKNVWVIAGAKSAKDGKMISLNDWHLIKRIHDGSKGQKMVAARQAAGI